MDETDKLSEYFNILRTILSFFWVYHRYNAKYIHTCKINT
jgi:hypothetical protein